MNRYSQALIVFVAMAGVSGLNTVVAQTAEEIDRVRAFDLSKVPTPEELLEAISDRAAYQTPVGQYHALGAIYNALTGLMMSFPFGNADTPAQQAEIDAFKNRLQVTRTAYFEKMETLKPSITDDRNWKIPQHRLRLPIVLEFMPEWAELHPDLIERDRLKAAEEAGAEAQEERLGVVPLAIFLAAALAGIFVVLRRTARGVSDPGFDFQLTSNTAEVVQEKSWHVTETSGTISGGNSSPHSLKPQITGNISSETTHHQEVTLRHENGREEVLQYTNFEVGCIPGNTLSLAYVNRPGMATSQGAIYNHNRDEMHFFRDKIRSAIRPPTSGMPWISWWLLFALLFAGVAWFGGATMSEGIEIAIISVLLVTVVPIIVVGLIVKMISAGVTRSRVPKVVSGIKNLMSELKQKSATQ